MSLKIAIVSLFRDCTTKYIQEYMDRSLALTGDFELEWFLVEGDSKNETKDWLIKATDDPRFNVLSVKTGIPHLGSTVHPARFKCLALTANTAIDMISLGDYDYMLFVDSDLIYKPDLLEKLASLNLDVVAPLVMVGQQFYDIWGFRGLNGKSVGPHMAWVNTLNPIQLSTIGGCGLFKHSYIADGARMRDDGPIIGLCADCTDRGAKVWCDPKTVIWHPLENVPNTYEAHMSKFGDAVPGKGKYDNWLSFGERTEHKGALRVDVREVADQVEDIRKLSFPDNKFDGVECYHVIEHLLPEEAPVAMSELFRVIKPGGQLAIAVPDLAKCARLVLEGNRQILMNIFSPHPDEAQRHRWGYTPKMFKELISGAGFIGIEEIPSPIDPNEIRIRCQKPG